MNSSLHTRVAERFGVLPNFFRLASADPQITENLWGFAQFAYLDNPIPSLFKERLFVYLSRFCKIRYCIARHLGFLVGLGKPAGDASCQPQTIGEVLPLLRRTLPFGPDLDQYLSICLERGGDPVFPGPDTREEQAIFACAAHVFVQTSDASRCLAALQHAFDPAKLEHIRLFLAFVRTAHYWTEIHPELVFEDDINQLLHTHEALAACVLSEPAYEDDLSQQISGELASLRDLGTRHEQLKQSYEILSVDHRQTAAELREREEDIHYMVLLSPQVSWTADAEGRVQYLHPKWSRVTGLISEQTIAGGWLQAVHPEDFAEVSGAWAKSLRTGVPFDMEHRIDPPSGQSLWVRSLAFPRRDANGRVIKWYGTTENIDQRKKTEIVMLRTEKLAAVGRLASSIAHEINNPLESIFNLVYLARGTNDPAKIDEYLAAADQELNRVSAITSQSLRFHKQPTQATPVVCDDLLTSVLSLYEGRLQGSKVKVERRKLTDRPVMCFESEIRQALSNFIGNAIDAMTPVGGRLLLRSSEATDWKTGEKVAAMIIADTGPGMSIQAKEHLFEPFFTTKGLRSNGLGLWISKEIVTRHKGRIKVKSSTNPPNPGTLVSILLPFDMAA
ncbi:MAG TPA: ATP-binding protein [Candidatus Angelobacter sp.]|nr:ATP-binding protein [Candidatus Angelobacter sp.]